MIQRLSDNERRVYSYLKQVFPNGATNTEIEEATRVHPHQQVFQITRRLMRQGWIRGEQGRYGQREWVFFALPDGGKEGKG